MLAQVIAVSATFAAVSSILMAVTMFVRDLLAAPVENSRQRLTLFPKEPTGVIDRWFFQLVEESGSELEMNTWTLIVVGGGVLGLGLPLVMFDSLIGGAIGLVLGCWMPILYLNVYRFLRLRNMRAKLPEALQVVADAVRSGQTLQESCELVARDTHGPLAKEFAQAASQMSLGNTPLSVMQRMARRIPLQEFGVFATAVTVHRRAGGNLSLLTERMAKASRDRQDVTNYLMAVTAGSRLSAIGMTVGSIVAMAMLAWLEPDYVAAFTRHDRGPWFLGVAVTLQAIGAFWVWRVLKVNY